MLGGEVVEHREERLEMRIADEQHSRAGALASETAEAFTPIDQSRTVAVVATAAPVLTESM